MNCLRGILDYEILTVPLQCYNLAEETEGWRMELEYSTANEELITDAVYELITAR